MIFEGVFIGTETKHDSLTHDDCTRWSVKLLHATAAEGDQLEGLLLLQGFVIIKTKHLILDTQKYDYFLIVMNGSTADTGCYLMQTPYLFCRHDPGSTVFFASIPGALRSPSCAGESPGASW